jgi:hypothetical protein
MIRKVVSGTHEEVKPDVLIPYIASNDKAKLADSSMCVISVRPESNKVKYEATIIQSVSPFADAVYLASLSGSLVNDKAIIATHYSSQLQFAINGKKEMSKYPEMVSVFEEKFNENFHGAPIIGAYEAILDFKIRSDGEDLFRTMVPASDFLDLYGQTIKKIDGYYVLNYDIPAIITRHHKETHMFIMALRLKDNSTRFSELHHLIYDNMCKNEETTILGPKSREKLPMEWYNRIRRTYHMSKSHIEAMFDLTDYVFKDESERIDFAATPLGQRLIKEAILPEDQLEQRMALLKNNPLVYLKQPDGSAKLVDIILEGKIRSGSKFIEHDLLECCKLIEKIDWQRIEN